MRPNKIEVIHVPAHLDDYYLPRVGVLTARSVKPTWDELEEVDFVPPEPCRVERPGKGWRQDRVHSCGEHLYLVVWG